MAIIINTIYIAVQKVISKETGSGYLDPSQFNVFANMSNVELFNKYADIYQDTQRVTDKIIPFIKKSVQSIDEDGHMAYPTNYVDKIAVRAFNPDEYDAAAKIATDAEPIDYDELSQIKIKTIDNDKLGDRLSSSVLKPDRNHPITTFYDTYAQFYPINTGSCLFEYLRQPVDVLWAYTLDANGLEVYNSTLSINYEFNWMMQNELIIKICQYFGVSVREKDLVEYSQGMQSQQA